MVLLKNDKHVLPFPKNKKVAVIGPHGNATQDMVGNYIGQICPSSPSDFSCIMDPFTAIRQKNKGGSTTFSHGCSVTSHSKHEVNILFITLKNFETHIET